MAEDPQVEGSNLCQSGGWHRLGEPPCARIKRSLEPRVVQSTRLGPNPRVKADPHPEQWGSQGLLRRALASSFHGRPSREVASQKSLSPGASDPVPKEAGQTHAHS